MKIAILVASFIAVAVNAAVPGEIAAPGVCVYPTQKDYRCNGNEKLSEADEAAVLAEIGQMRQNVDDWVFAGDIDSLMTIYMDDIKYIFGDVTVVGIAELRVLMTNVLGAGGRRLTRSHMQDRVLSRRHVMMVGGEWSYPDGFHGIYYNGDIYRQDDGTWKHTFVNVKATP